jgi:hypothetical protein
MRNQNAGDFHKPLEGIEPFLKTYGNLKSVKTPQISCSIPASQKAVSLRTTSPKPELPSPQAFHVSDKLAATFSKLTAAL